MEEKNQNLQEAWEKTGETEFMRIIKDCKGDNLNEALTSEQKAFWETAFDEKQEKSKVLICADERVLPLFGEFKIGTAGQLILDSKNYTESFVNNFKGKIKTVRSHSGCGAAGIAYAKLSEEDKHKFIGVIRALSLQGLPVDEMSEGDLYGTYHSYNLAKKLDAIFEHTAFSGMRGYKEFHDARIIFWSADPIFDPSGLVDKFFPPHFLSNGLAFGLSEDFCKEELKILAGIALGTHGLGSFFNSEDPFYAISVGKDKEEAERINILAKETLGEFRERTEFKYYCNK